MIHGPLVSVVIPVFNGEAYLADALDSVVAQDYTPIEIIVVDDGSTDGTPAVAGRYPRVRYVRQSNQGPSAARNTGIALSTGEFVTFLDADDVMLPERIRLQVAALVADPRVDCVLARQRTLTEPGDSAAPEGSLPRDHVFGDVGGVQPQSSLVRRSVFERAGTFDPSYRWGEGMEWLSRLRRAGIRIALVDRQLTRKRVHGANLSMQSGELQAALLRTMRVRVDARHADRPRPVSGGQQ